MPCSAIDHRWRPSKGFRSLRRRTRREDGRHLRLRDDLGHGFGRLRPRQRLAAIESRSHGPVMEQIGNGAVALGLARGPSK